MENGRIKDTQITASTEYGSTATLARLNSYWGWSPLYNHASQWIQVSLGSLTNLTGIATQGAPTGNYRILAWVSKYQLQYGDDGVNFRNYKALCESFPKVKLYPGDNFKLLHAFMVFLQSSKHLSSFTAN